MAVESRFVVIRHGVEAKTFMDKKSADEYDKMLDMADNLAEIFAQSPIEINESMSEELSVYLAQHRDDVLVALLAKKAAVKKTAELVKSNDNAGEKIIEEKSEKVKKTSKTTKAKKSKTKTDEIVSEAS
ncbi:MAG: YebG family protein [Colwellia sp.]|nr:YebG family protein [Colwellia sp.]